MTCLKWQYTGPKLKRFKQIEVGDLSVREIRDMVRSVVSDDDKLFFAKDAVTPDHGFKLIRKDSDVKKMVEAVKKAGTGVCKIHVFHSWSKADPPVVSDDSEAEVEDNVNEEFDYGDDWDSDEGSEHRGEGSEHRGDSNDEDESDEEDEDDIEKEIGDGSDSDLSDCRRIRDEVRKEQKDLESQLSQEIRDTLKMYKGKQIDSDSDSEYCESYTSDETDEDVAYAEPKAKSIKARVNQVFDMGTAAKNIKWVAGLIFKDKAQVKATVRAFSIETGRPLKYSVNDLCRIQVVCAKGCPFKMWLSFIKEKECWQVRTVNNEHNCVYHYDNKLVTVKYLAELYGNRIRRNPSWKLKEMQEEFKKELKVEVGEAKCCRVRQRALSQVHEEMVKHFAGLRRFGGEILRSNKNNTVKICTTRNNEEDDPHFQRFYVCYDQLKKGWKEGCRPVIGLDGCFLKTVTGGQMLSAVGRDGNDSMFPIAMAVVESESYSSWAWFLMLLIDDLDLRSGSGYTLISDQQKVC